MTRIDERKRKLKWNRRDLTRDCSEEVCELYRDGYSLRELGLKFGFTKNAIWKVLVRNKVDMRPNVGQKCPETRCRDMKFAARIRAGSNFKLVCTEFGICQSTGRGILRRVGLRISPMRMAKTDVQAKEAHALFVQGLAYKEIASRLFCSYSWVEQLIRRARRMEQYT